MGFFYLKNCLHPAFKITYGVEDFLIIWQTPITFYFKYKRYGSYSLIDIGTGPTDILVFYPDTHEHYKAVCCSAIKKIAEAIQGSCGDLVISGTIMGGGAVSKRGYSACQDP